MRRETGLSDAQLLAGDADSFCVVYDRHLAELYRWFTARAGAAAADLTAETFARAWLSRRRFRDEAGGSAAPWLYGIAQNVLRQSARKRRVEDAARRKLGLPVDLYREEGYDQVDERLSLPPLATDSLLACDRRALELRIVEGRSYGDVAAALGCSPAAARLRVSRALRRLRAAT